jgi:DNA-binding HxlR family transcriptional regulator
MSAAAEHPAGNAGSPGVPEIDDDVMRSKGLAREVFNQLADKWTLLVIHALGQVPKLRFCQLRDQIEGVSQKMLTQTLRQLERDGLVSRHVYPVVPPRVEYKLTPLGHSLLATVRGICAWVHDHIAEIEQSRQGFDVRPLPEDLCD